MVTLSVPVGEAGTLKAGSAVVVVRLDGTELPATVGSISTAVVGGDSGQSQGRADRHVLAELGGDHRSDIAEGLKW